MLSDVEVNTIYCIQCTNKSVVSLRVGSLLRTTYNCWYCGRSKIEQTQVDGLGRIIRDHRNLASVLTTVNRGYGCWKRVSVSGVTETGTFTATEPLYRKVYVAEAILSDLFWDTSLSYVTHMTDSCTQLEWIHKGRLFDHED